MPYRPSLSVPALPTAVVPPIVMTLPFDMTDWPPQKTAVVEPMCVQFLETRSNVPAMLDELSGWMLPVVDGRSIIRYESLPGTWII